jgi:hypothetical protein
VSKGSVYRTNIKVLEARIATLTRTIDREPDSPSNGRRRHERKALRWALRVIQSNPVMAQDMLAESEGDE